MEIGTLIIDRFGRQGKVINKTTLALLDSGADEGDLPYLECQSLEGEIFYCCEYECKPLGQNSSDS